MILMVQKNTLELYITKTLFSNEILGFLKNTYEVQPYMMK